MKNIRILIIMFFIFSLIGCSLGKDKTKYEVGLQGIKRINFKPVQLDKVEKWGFFEKMKGLQGYSISYGNDDSIPYFWQDDSLYSAQVSDDEYILYYNSGMLKNTGIVILSSRKFRKAKLFTLGEIEHINIYQSNGLYILQLTENMGVFAFDNPKVLKEWFIVLSTKNIELISALSVLKKGSVLQDDKLISMNFDTVRTQEGVLKIDMTGLINKKNVTATIEFKGDSFKIPENLKERKWNEIPLIESVEIKPRNINF